jgi:hypothetical protein
MRSMTVDKEKLEEKIGEAIGLEMAAQKAVDEHSSKGLLDRGAISKLEDMKKEANSHQTQLEGLVQKLLQSNGLDSGNVQDIAYCNYHFRLASDCLIAFSPMFLFRLQSQILYY